MTASVTIWNKGKAPAGGTGWNLTPDVRAGLESMNVVVPVANKDERDGITPPLGKYAGMAVYRMDKTRLEAWNGSRWAVTAVTEIGHQYVQPLTIAGTSYATVASVNCESLGGKLKLSYTGVVENANSGANRTVDVQWLIDGTPFGGVTYNAPLVSGVPSPATSVAMEREYAIAAGSHTIDLQTRASDASSVRNVIFSLTVKENP